MIRSLALLFLLLAACSSREPVEKERLVLALEAPPETLDRRMALGANAMKVAQLVTPGLTRIDDTGMAVPDLAERFHAEDETTWVFTLREGLVFSDGTPLTSEDVVATWRSVLDPALGSPHRGGYGYVETLETRDERTIAFHLRAPFGAMPIDASLAILPARLTDPVHLETVRRNPIGAGPFVVGRHLRDDGLLLEPNPRYFRGAPSLPVEVRTVRDETTRILELRKGRVDVLLGNVSPALLPALRQEKHLHVEVGPGAGVSYLMFNLEDPILSRVEVRRAIALAVDREALALYKFKGAARVADSILRPEHWAFESSIQRYQRDLPEARRLLDEAGLKSVDGGPRLRLSFKTSTDRFRRSIALVMAAQLAEVGIKIDVQPLEWGTFMGDVKRGNFQLATLKMTPVVDPDILRLAFHTGSIPEEANGWGGFNRMRYRNPTLDQWLIEGRETSDPERRKEAYARVQQVVARDLPALPLLHEDAIGIVSTRLEGVAVDPAGSLFSLSSARLAR